MVQTVPQNNFFSPDNGIVSRGLFECFLGKFDFRSFTFDENFWNCFFGYQQVNPFGCSVKFQFFFLKSARINFVS